VRTLLKLFSVVVGVALLAGAAVILWMAHGPQPTDAVTTGGVSYTQQELANSPQLEASVDIESSDNSIPFDVELSESASADLQTFDSAEIAAAPPPPSQPQVAPQFSPQIADLNAVALTTDVVLDANTAVQVAPVAGSSEMAPDGQGGFAAAAGGYEQRVVEVEWPAEFRVGRGGSVRIKLKMLESGALQPVAEIADNEILATPILITDRYDTHYAFVTSNLSAPDFSVQATSPLRQQLFKGGETEWRYTLKSNNSQRSVISIGLIISWDPINPATTPPGPQNVPIWGQALAVDVNYVFGFITVPQASIAGTALAVIGFLAEAPILSAVLEHFVGRLLGRGSKREREEQRRRSQRARRR
jgi:hypothetical protein